jgi:hypothetical protein
MGFFPNSSHEPIVEYIESQYDQFFKMEKRTVRVRNELHDNRIHACIYMLDATGHGYVELAMLDVLTDTRRMLLCLFKCTLLRAKLANRLLGSDVYFLTV